ncbi:MAG TPA: hypothetical protein DCZ94_10690 [Lentisphaeria bacterium]|nr:MAG: hypothetical protein A2X48_06565 [Lentisphaerae bacterium GWF2_49_21]HBC87411.1 hypothetical protein [Lentisphaeria bacterium]
MRIDLGDDDHIEIMLVPLIDCLCFLVFFFLAASTLKKVEKELPIQLPKSSAAVSVSGSVKAFAIAIDREGRVYLGSQPVSADLLHQRIREVSRLNPSQKIRLDVDASTRGQDIIRILDLCQFEGLKNVSFHIADAKSFSK